MLDSLTQKVDAEIDCSDDPETHTNTFQNRSGIAGVLRRRKRTLTLSLDDDLVAWAESDKARFEDRANALLRKAMLDSDDLKKSA